MRIAIYAHFSPDSRVRWFTWSFLESLIAIGFQVIFVSNSPVCNEDLLRLYAMKIDVIIRENIGLDFAMWKDGLQKIDLSEVYELLLTNSSIAGPLFPLSEIFEKSRLWNCSFWGITDNTEFAPHLQSYFIVLGKQVIESQAFQSFWNAVLPYQSKNQIIRSYEIGFTVWLEEHGFTWRPLISQDDVWRAYSAKRSFFEKVSDRIFKRKVYFENIALSYPELIINMGCPFMKSSLLESGGQSITACKAAKIFSAANRKAKPTIDKIIGKPEIQNI